MSRITATANVFSRSGLFRCSVRMASVLSSSDRTFVFSASSLPKPIRTTATPVHQSPTSSSNLFNSFDSPKDSFSSAACDESASASASGFPNSGSKSFGSSNMNSDVLKACVSGAGYNGSVLGGRVVEAWMVQFEDDF